MVLIGQELFKSRKGTQRLGRDDKNTLIDKYEIYYLNIYNTYIIFY